MGLATIRQAAVHLRPDDHRQRSWMFHQEARLLVEAGETEKAAPILDRATALYRDLGDTNGEAKALITRVGVLEALGDSEGALASAHAALEIAERHGHGLLEAAARIDVGRLLVKSDSVAEGVEQLRAALAKAVLLDDMTAEFHAHYHLWKAYAAAGEQDRMRFAFQSAAFLVQSIDEPSPEANEVRNEAEKTRNRPHRRSR
jgi:tetratricopeptide (TPR) repeat protein